MKGFDPSPRNAPVLQLVPAQGTGDVHNVQFPLLFARPEPLGYAKVCPKDYKRVCSPSPSFTTSCRTGYSKKKSHPLHLDSAQKASLPLSRRASISLGCCNAPKDLDPAPRMDEWMQKARDKTNRCHLTSTRKGIKIYLNHHFISLPPI